MSELKPCPFCGGEARLSQYPFCDIIQCENEGCYINPSLSMSHDNADHSAQKLLIEAWNRRANDAD